MLTRYAQRHVTWIDLIAPTPAEVKQVVQEFGIDPAFGEELMSASYKPKVERRGDALFLILHFPAPRVTRRSQEVDFIIGKNFLITARYEVVDPLHAFAKAFEVDTVLAHNAHQHGGHVFVAMATALYRALLDECTAIHNRLEDIEDRIFQGREKQMVVELSQAARMLHGFRQALIPHRDMLASLEPLGGRLFGEEFTYYVRGLVGAYERVNQSVEHQRDSLDELRNTNNSLLTTKQNEIMKRFTILAFLFLPLSFVAGVFGMNTEHNPIVGHPLDFWIVIGLMLALAVVSYGYVKYKKWL